MLIALALLLCLGQAMGRECEPHQFASSFFDKCVNCSECRDPLVVIRPCQSTRDTLCGPASLQLDWSWTKHDSEQPVKPMTKTFEENEKGIKQHEMHVKQMQNLLKKIREGHGPVETEQQLWDHLKALGRDKETPEISQDLVKKLNRLNVPSEDANIFDIPMDSIHFSSQEASDLLKGVSHTEEPLKFGFFPQDEDEDKPNDDDDDYLFKESDENFTFPEKVVLDYQTAVVVFAVTTIVVFFLALLCYCLRLAKGSFAYPDDLSNMQFWKQAPYKPNKLVPSTIYKTTTEVIGRESSGNYKYLERIINKAVKKSRVPSKMYRAAKPSMETRPLTAESQASVHSPRSKFQDSLQSV